MTDCIFCRIVSGMIPANIVARNDYAVAFHDLNPQAPTHILVVPTMHLNSVSEAVGDAGANLMGRVMRLCIEVAADLGVQQSGYRLVINTGEDGGQSVGHLHVHLLGGRSMKWPPG